MRYLRIRHIANISRNFRDWLWVFITANKLCFEQIVYNCERWKWWKWASVRYCVDWIFTSNDKRHRFIGGLTPYENWWFIVLIWTISFKRRVLTHTIFVIQLVLLWCRYLLYRVCVSYWIFSFPISVTRSHLAFYGPSMHINYISFVIFRHFCFLAHQSETTTNRISSFPLTSVSSFFFFQLDFVDLLRSHYWNSNANKQNNTSNSRSSYLSSTINSNVCS